MPKQPPTRLAWAIEALVIVGSILLAFAIDAAWDGAQERRANRDLMAAVLDEIRDNREALEEVKEGNATFRTQVDAFFRATPDELRQLGPDSSRAVLRSLILVPDFAPLDEAARAFSSSTSRTPDGMAARREVGEWLRASDRLQDLADETRARALQVDQLISEHAVGGRAEGLSFLPSMVMRSGPEALVRVWADDALSAALIAKGTSQTVYGLQIDRTLEMLDSLEAFLATRTGG